MKPLYSHNAAAAATAAVALMLGVLMGAAAATAKAPKPVMETAKAPKPAIETVIYDCINIQHAPAAESYPYDHEARHALRRLATACEEQEHALALMRVWEADPTAGVVLEETETESK